MIFETAFALVRLNSYIIVYCAGVSTDQPICDIFYATLCYKYIHRLTLRLNFWISTFLLFLVHFYLLFLTKWAVSLLPILVTLYINYIVCFHCQYLSIRALQIWNHTRNCNCSTRLSISPWTHNRCVESSERLSSQVECNLAPEINAPNYTGNKLPAKRPSLCYIAKIRCWKLFPKSCNIYSFF